MKKDDIKKASEQYANDVCRSSLHRCGLEQFCMVDFIEGAKWRINSVWHDTKEIPKKSFVVLAIRKDGSIEKVFFTNILRWKSLVKICGFVKWAYVEDLIPNNIN